jgi:hypothetical protein
MALNPNQVGSAQRMQRFLSSQAMLNNQLRINQHGLHGQALLVDISSLLLLLTKCK